MLLNEATREENERLLNEWNEMQRIQRMLANIPEAAQLFFEEIINDGAKIELYYEEGQECMPFKEKKFNQLIKEIAQKTGKKEEVIKEELRDMKVDVGYPNLLYAAERLHSKTFRGY